MNNEFATTFSRNTIHAMTVLFAVFFFHSAHAVDFIQIGRLSGDNVCGNVETGIGDDASLKFHRGNKFSSSDRIRIQRGSTIAVRLLGHGADLGPTVAENATGFAAQITNTSRYSHYPNASLPMGFVEVRLSAKSNAELGNENVVISWPIGRFTIPLRILKDCEQTGVVPTAHLSKDRCFGALGQQCGAIPTIGITAACSGNLCLVNGGSWQHDECCAVHHGGDKCGGPETFLGNDGFCRSEFGHALGHFVQGLNWHREVNVGASNRTGKVVAADYCAPSGTVVAARDARYCCAALGITRNPSLGERRASEGNLMVKGYVTSGPAHVSGAPSGTIACE